MSDDESRGSIAPAVLVEASALLSAWHWLISSLSPRPNTHQGEYIYDHKSWQDDSGSAGPLACQVQAIQSLHDLYFASQLGDFASILNLVQMQSPTNVFYYEETLDPDICGVIQCQRRFRNHLSEHLSFWVRLATAAIDSCETSEHDVKFAHSRPNIQPEDKGPDGLFMKLDENGSVPTIELISVKNSTIRPARLIASKAFRESGTIGTDGKSSGLLEEFFACRKRAKGLHRLDTMLEEVCGRLSYSSDQKLRHALLVDVDYNGVVVADECYANQELFKGFRFVHEDAAKCIGTYVGSECWTDLSESVRKGVLDTLHDRGLI